MKLVKGNKSEVYAIIFAGLILTGCGAVGEGSDKQSTAEINKSSTSREITYLPEAGLTLRQRFAKALEKLENGEEGQALAELNAYLGVVPSSNSAKNLVEQITTDSAKYFPAEFFTVNLVSGTSLSTLSKKYLGSALKFYALAKYNNISNPSRVNIGQEIKIPMTQLAKTIRQREEIKPVETPLELVEKPQHDDIVEVPDVTASSLINELKELIQSGDFSSAIEKVEELANFGEFDKTRTDLALSAYIGRAKQLAESDNVRASDYYSKAGHLELINGDAFKAFGSFKLATELDEGNAQAMEDMLLLQKDIADKYHREASSAFRRQELDLAIEKWDMVLKVSPDHSSAKLYRAQALELKEKLDNINQN